MILLVGVEDDLKARIVEASPSCSLAQIMLLTADSVTADTVLIVVDLRFLDGTQISLLLTNIRKIPVLFAVDDLLMKKLAPAATLPHAAPWDFFYRTTGTHQDLAMRLSRLLQKYEGGPVPAPALVSPPDEELHALRRHAEDLERKYSHVLWKILRKFKFTSIPAIVKMVDDDKQVGPYKVLQFVGKGSFGVVRVASHDEKGSRVAIKTIAKSAMLSVEAVERLDSEIKLLAMLSHASIIKLMEVLHSTDHVHIVMEYMSGGSLEDFIDSNKPLSESTVTELFHGVLAGVEYMHARRTCHRDLKPENVLLTSAGLGTQQPKIIDLGFACKNPPGETLSQFCGSVMYMAPEIYAGMPYDGLAADCWSLGILLAVMIIGSAPPTLSGLDSRLKDIVEDKAELMAAYRCVVTDILSTPAICSVSDALQQLLAEMLSVDARGRLTAEQALQSAVFGTATSSVKKRGTTRPKLGRGLSEDSSKSPVSSTTPRRPAAEGSGGFEPIFPSVRGSLPPAEAEFPSPISPPGHTTGSRSPRRRPSTKAASHASKF